VTGLQVRKIVQEYLRNHPEEQREPASSIAAIALLDAFTCPKNSN
jgi:hypothetical protein